ncbi:hypothetical protein RJ639_036064 [Escallonia herrerae]|uniref:Transposase (putative) gypsy type domain-containing protein n=1 Tax=Escallonia herrerae TaxID=1293975 RepID=A0AA88WNU2_9ASTE|nr:hypothetical protein RJ639_036064 [Escallonia herrerae]
MLRQSVRTRFCSGKILLGRCHSVRAECLNTILLGQDSVRPLSLCSGRVFGPHLARARFCSDTVTLYAQSVRTRSCSGRILFGHYLGSLHVSPSPLILQEPANYGTKFETGIYEEQVKSGYRLPLHPFALRFFEHYSMAPGQLVPNGWRKLAGLIYLVRTSGYKPDATYFMRVFFEICFVKGVANCPGCMSSAETVPLEMASGSGKSPKGGLLGVLQKAKGKRKEKRLTVELPLLLRGLESLLQNMYASGSEMLSRFEMARQVAADEAQQKREVVNEAREASHRAEELSKQEANHLAQIATLEKRLERVKRKAAEEKRADDGLEIYELGFAKAKEMFAERFPDILLDDFVLPAVISPSGETVLPSEAGDATASHPPGEGPSGDAPEP